MALSNRFHLAVGLTALAAGVAVMAMDYLDWMKQTGDHLRTLVACHGVHSVNGMECLAKDGEGNPLSIDINTPETPRP